MSPLLRSVRMRLSLLALLFLSSPLVAATIEVRDAAALRDVLPRLTEGDILRIAPGEYPGGSSVSNIPDLTVEALDPEKPPHFEGGTQAWHFSRCPGLKLRHLRCSGQSANGINLDDGGQRDNPVAGVLLEHLSVSDIGPKGNFDGIKCSGLKDLRISHCEISGWGGQAIDFVGCSDAVISDCKITGKEGFSQHTGPQFKGGCRNITIERCTLINAGERPIQAGGSTGADYFRPAGANYEAKDIMIRDNRIEGGTCACAFTGVRGAEFTGNTIVRPVKWIFRILQETTTKGFLVCGDVKISGNTITFRREQVGSEINIGAGADPGSFVFFGNKWLAEDRPQDSKPTLPSPEKDGVYGAKPE
ncbi:right-handed parallel beta-helix repeat-containing protein [Luteolibacter luteus]|uniref:Right-handed parallel beta-helix repeat-containing protein n=1 Tax=Luteolibacter luteus TaxID=2728835 RepID=A0A858RFT6_9BACT|nr:right-handed parallel beta-helix repeat-containing protein [Luteolibacter luteus]QJE95424.1 right-handed parallel beta-helix repeat-containing protein [Luteolibacter luteus]